MISTLGIGTVGVHVYPLSVCKTPRAATLNGLLEQSVGDAPQRLSWVVADARAAGAQAVITEANSVSCGGKSGVSDSPASAVWAVRFVLSALKTGFGEVRFHFSGDPYDPFYLRGGEVVRRPLEAAMVALNQWLPVGATLRSVAGLGGIAATAIAAPGMQPLLLLDNGERKAQDARAARRSRHPHADLQRERRAAGAASAEGTRAPRAGGDPGQHGARSGVLSRLSPQRGQR